MPFSPLSSSSRRRKFLGTAHTKEMELELEMRKRFNPYAIKQPWQA